jgi:hypothetical protein
MAPHVRRQMLRCDACPTAHDGQLVARATGASARPVRCA